MEYVLGLDTSNYTTSVAALSLDGERLADIRRLLPVATGQRGLRQSDALFFHVQHLPLLFVQLRNQLPETAHLYAVAASVRPRPMSTSYMPVFRAAESYAEVISQLYRVPVIRTSHQEGHLQAAVDSLDDGRPDAAVDAPFFALHLSGGTTDFMVARMTRFGYHINRIGESADLHVGQFVDRVGVALGLPFPAGPHLEQLAAALPEGESLTIPIAVKGVQMSFSGPCSAALRAISKGAAPAAAALGVQICIADSITKALRNAAEVEPTMHRAVIAGGVAANAYIQARVLKQAALLIPNLDVQFADPRYASDNACGVAGIARRFLAPVATAGGTQIRPTL